MKGLSLPRARRRASVPEGKAIQIRVVGYERGGPLELPENRPAIRYVQRVGPSATRGERVGRRAPEQGGAAAAGRRRSNRLSIPAFALSSRRARPRGLPEFADDASEVARIEKAAQRVEQGSAPRCRRGLAGGRRRGAFRRRGFPVPPPRLPPHAAIPLHRHRRELRHHPSPPAGSTSPAILLYMAATATARARTSARCLSTPTTLPARSCSARRPADSRSRSASTTTAGSTSVLPTPRADRALRGRGPPAYVRGGALFLRTNPDYEGARRPSSR